MAEVIAVTNQKGGVGKSTTAWALGGGLALRGARVLYVDMDAQGNLTHSLGADDEAPVGIMDVLLRGEDVRDAIVSTPQGDVVPSSSSLAGADITISNEAPQREFVLKRALAPIASSYDVIVIDTPPTLGVATVNALVASNGVIIPATADVYSVQGIGQLFQTVEAVRRYSNPFIKIRGILVTRHSDRTIIGREVAGILSQVATRIRTKMYGRAIRECVDIRSAQFNRRSIYDFAPDSHAAEDYMALTDEYINDWRSSDVQREERAATRERAGASVPFWRRGGEDRTGHEQQDDKAVGKR